MGHTMTLLPHGAFPLHCLPHGARRDTVYPVVFLMGYGLFRGTTPHGAIIP